MVSEGTFRGLVATAIIFLPGLLRTPELPPDGSTLPIFTIWMAINLAFLGYTIVLVHFFSRLANAVHQFILVTAPLFIILIVYLPLYWISASWWNILSASVVGTFGIGVGWFCIYYLIPVPKQFQSTMSKPQV